MFSSSGARALSLLAPVVVLWVAVSASVGAQGADCGEWRACRDAALEAADRGDFEGFHDLAWRTVQKGPPRDADLMYMLARAMSLSGRPGDAIVMLRRLAERGMATDVASNEDFRRVRRLPAWPEVEALMAGPDTAPTSPALGAGTAATAPAPVVAAAVADRPLAPSVAAEAPAAIEPPRARIEEALRLPMRGMSPGGFAYDAVSGRFLLGAEPRKIVVIAEESQRTDDLVRADSAGFYDITAMAIDTRRGDLWVVSSGKGEPVDGETEGAPRAALHKVQLISGRPLNTLEPEAADGPARFTDVAVTDGGLVVVLDALGRRLFRIAPGGARLEVAARLGDVVPTSLSTSNGERFVFVAHERGLARVDLAGGTVLPLLQPADLDTTGVGRVRWYQGSLIAVQAQADGSRRVVRFTLGMSGRAVVAAEVLDDSAGAGDGAALAALAGDWFYYLAGVAGLAHDGEPGAKAPETVVRRLRLR